MSYFTFKVFTLDIKNDFQRDSAPLQKLCIQKQKLNTLIVLNVQQLCVCVGGCSVKVSECVTSALVHV